MALRKKIFLLLAFFLTYSPSAFSAEPIPVELQEVGIEEHLGQKISLNLPFTDEQGNLVLLEKFFDKKRPVLLTLVYYGCPNLCNFMLNGLNQTLKKMPWKVGDQFQIVSVSIDPGEKPDLASKKKLSYLADYGRVSAEEGWHFLTGDEKNIQALAREIGFKYKYDEDQKQYAHAAAVFVLTPEGKISRTLYGIEFNPRDLKLALLEAGEGKIGSVVDRLLLFCYHYDPKGRKYALMAVRLMQGAAGLTILGLILLWMFLSRNKKART